MPSRLSIWSLVRESGRQVRRSCERLLREGQTPLHLFHRRTRARVFVLEIRANRPASALQKLQDVADRGIGLAPRPVGLRDASLHVLDMEVGDLRVMLLDERHGVESGCGEVTD